MTVESMKKTSSYVEKANQWLLTNKYGQWILLALAPFMVTPDLFNTVHDGEKSLYAQFEAKKVIVVAGSAFSALMTQGLVRTFKALNPSLQGYSGAEYSSALELFGSMTFFFCWVCTFGMIWLYGSLGWWGHRFVRWRSKRAGKTVISVPKAYFTLVVSSVVFWFGVFCRLLVNILPPLPSQNLTCWLDYLKAHPWLFGLLLLVMCCLMHWFSKIKNKAACQLYPTEFYRFAMPVGTALIFSLSVIVIFNVGGALIDLLLRCFPEAILTSVLQHIFSLAVGSS